MITARQIVESSLRILGVIGRHDEPTHKEVIDGLSALNRLIHSMAEIGADYEHSDFSLQSDASTALGLSTINLWVVVLAEELAPEYQVQLEPVAQRRAFRARRLLIARKHAAPPNTEHGSDVLNLQVTTDRWWL